MNFIKKKKLLPIKIFYIVHVIDSLCGSLWKEQSSIKTYKQVIFFYGQKLGAKAATVCL